jgi:Uma2 family endonuclease
METVSKITYEDYLKIDDGKQYEVIEGELKMVPAPNFKHQNISLNLCLILANYVRKNKLGVIRDAPIDVILDKTNVVQPDLVFISKERTPIINEDGGILGVPDLVIEIISKGSKYIDTYKKKDLYEKFGIKEYWLVDPFSQSVEIFTLDDNKKYELYSEAFIEEDSNRILKSKTIENLEINVEDVFKKDW